MLKVGAATRVINNEIGRRIQAATHEQSAKYIRDDLEANLLYLSNEDESLILISCDCAVLGPDDTADIRHGISAQVGIPEQRIIVTCTHTHSGPVVLQTNPFSLPDDEWLGRLKLWLVEAAKLSIRGGVCLNQRNAPRFTFAPHDEHSIGIGN